MKIILPKLGANMDSAVLTKWLVAEGEPVEKNNAVAEISTDKVTMEIEAPEDGIVVKQYFKEDDDVPVGAVIAEIGSAAQQSPDPAKPNKAAAPEQDAKLAASPSARKLAHKMGIDLSVVKGTGPRGRIVSEDIMRYANSEQAAGEKKEAAGQLPEQAQVSGNTPDPTVLAEPSVQREQAESYRLTRIEKLSGERMLQSLQSTAQLTLSRDVDVTGTLALLDSLKSAKQARITFTAVVLLAVCKALQVHKRFNGKLKNGEIIIGENVDLNVAVATEQGLLVPVIRELQSKSLLSVSEALARIVDKARGGKLEADDYATGNFTVTNLGASGVDTFTPILYPGQIGILGVGRILKRSWVFQDNLEIRSIVSLSLTWDHQAVDGYPAAQFMKSVAEYLETPGLML
ncbi:dihydrolipoamide acetyltransferase family protein [Paenibacillus abyssi]|uniref:Dihydrolipoamide acetyltransferase component of pyruvate dehydrogenase complex n=1 Tax=Paenibacillus abyssi TaxID=1340531 RepID=A0A917D7D0_9BACL|nr:dihydrolipoamide acetyltransferase family protein [Paenibacillus abyssi]GGG13592.1 dihydrolipoyllysine-residue acetyltransferase component of acetoin cleaving system [Paenibacillus abyssi]